MIFTYFKSVPDKLQLKNIPQGGLCAAELFDYNGRTDVNYTEKDRMENVLWKI